MFHRALNRLLLPCVDIHLKLGLPMTVWLWCNVMSPLLTLQNKSINKYEPKELESAGNHDIQNKSSCLCACSPSKMCCSNCKTAQVILSASFNLSHTWLNEIREIWEGKKKHFKLVIFTSAINSKEKIEKNWWVNFKASRQGADINAFVASNQQTFNLLVLFSTTHEIKILTSKESTELLHSKANKCYTTTAIHCPRGSNLVHLSTIF